MPEWITTEDGSLSLVHAGLDEGYHNRAGAWTEAMETYVRPSELTDRYRQGEALHLIDGCFGLGYNTFALIAACRKVASTGQLTVTAIEVDPALVRLWPVILAQPCFAGLADLIPPFTTLNPHDSVQTLVTTGPHALTFTLHLATLEATLPTLSLPANAVFHDAFSPKKVPLLWTRDLLAHYYRLLKPCDGSLLTYSRAPQVLEALISLGFALEKTPPVGAKRGGTLARTAL